MSTLFKFFNLITDIFPYESRNILIIHQCNTIPDFKLFVGNIMVGQLNVKNPRPLSPELEEFVNKSIHGFIVVSFGTNVAFLAKKKVDLLAAAFGKLQQNVVWKLKGETLNV